MELGVASCYVGLLLITILAGQMWIPVWAQMLPMTCMIIFIGSKSAAMKGEHAVVSEKMTTKDAYRFPLVGSAVLFSLYLVFKFLPKEYINYLVKAYFFIFGVLVLAAQISRAVTIALPPVIAKPLTAVIFTIRFPCCKSGKEAKKEDTPSAQSSSTEQQTKGENQKEANANTNNGSQSDDKKQEVGIVEATSKSQPADNELTLSKIDIVAHILSIGLGAWYLMTNHWAASNLFGIAFSIQGIESISLGTYFNGFILLCGLFVYDVFWVFGTDVMVTVAKSFDAPIKLLFPQNALDANGDPLRPSLLGLGDIVIPGIYIALLLRFDLWLAERKAASATAAVSPTSAAANTTPQYVCEGDVCRLVKPTVDEDSHTIAAVSAGSAKKVPTPYFISAMVWYFIGLLTTLLVMYWFQHAQPALLYLVPTCLISAFSVAYVKGEVGLLWSFDENVPIAAEVKKDA